MPVSFEKITRGNCYSRRELAKIWGYSGYEALAMGLVTPKDDNKIILFITYEKQKHSEQYKDYLQGDMLQIEGPTDHFAEARMLNSQRTGDEIHVFYRNHYSLDFTYEGKFKIERQKLNATKPSSFTLRRA